MQSNLHYKERIASKNLFPLEGSGFRELDNGALEPGVCYAQVVFGFLCHPKKTNVEIQTHQGPSNSIQALHRYFLFTRIRTQIVSQPYQPVNQFN